jgi:hypothetical protein
MIIRLTLPDTLNYTTPRGTIIGHAPAVKFVIRLIAYENP